ncbi:MAG: phage tail protein [Burkholderiales bacterium]|nr:phage tail protein [Burkholderiales bacterium]
MAVLRDSPYSGCHFLVDIGTGNTEGVTAGFSEVVLPTAGLDVIQYRAGNGKEGRTTITGLEQYGNLILRRGVCGSLDLYQWWNDIRNGNVKSLRTVTVQLLSEDRSQVVLIWKFLRARPVALHYAPLVAGGSAVAIESVEIAFDRLEME